MEISIDQPSTEVFGAFHVLQIAPKTFLAQTMGLDYIQIPPNSAAEEHRHINSDNVILILRGTGTIILNGSQHEVRAGDRVMIPRAVWHGFRTSGESLEFISAQMPPILDKDHNNFDFETRGSNRFTPVKERK